jgi:hypothetical protein
MSPSAMSTNGIFLRIQINPSRAVTGSSRLPFRFGWAFCDAVPAARFDLQTWTNAVLHHQHAYAHGGANSWKRLTSALEAIEYRQQRALIAIL